MGLGDFTGSEWAGWELVFSRDWNSCIGLAAEHGDHGGATLKPGTHGEQPLTGRFASPVLHT